MKENNDGVWQSSFYAGTQGWYCLVPELIDVEYHHEGKLIKQVVPRMHAVFNYVYYTTVTVKIRNTLQGQAASS